MVHGLSRAYLEREGLEPDEAMKQLAGWVDEACAGRRPVFVGFNAPFDWMFVADYLWRFAGRNPFGISALDLKSYFMGRERIGLWGETRRVNVDERLGPGPRPQPPRSRRRARPGGSDAAAAGSRRLTR